MNKTAGGVSPGHVSVPPLEEPRRSDGQQRLRLLSYNIQAGISTSKYSHYITHSWKHILPCPKRLDNLDRIADVISDFDIVGLQEVDGGSLRSGFINQTEYLSLQARFPFWYDQTNRNLGKLARHSLGLLSHYSPSTVKEIKLPGMIPGRGALCVRFGHGESALILVVVHLALGRRARLRQLDCVAELLHGHKHVIVLGDLNCGPESMEMDSLLRRTDLCAPARGLHTFPSWHPQRCIDHILTSPTLKVQSVAVLNHPISDHLPIAMDVILPAEIRLHRSRSVADYSLPVVAVANA